MALRRPISVAVMIVLGLFVLGNGFAAPSTATAPSVNVAVSDSTGVSRIVFGFGHPVSYVVNEADDRFTVTFSNVPGIHFQGLENANLTYVTNPDLRLSGASVLLQFRKIGGAALRHYQEGGRVVFELAPLPPPVTAASEKKPEAQPKTPPGAPVSVLISSYPQRDEIRFAWAEPLIGAAVFVRGGYLWAVFDQPRPLALAPLASTKRLKAAGTFRTASATVARFRVASGAAASVTKDGNAWVVSVKDIAAPPEIPLDVNRTLANPLDPKIIIPAANTGGAMAIADPAIGDRIIVATLRDAGKGVDSPRILPDMELPATAQGVAIVPKSDHVSVQRKFNGIVIGSDIGLALSPIVPGIANKNITDALNASPLDFNVQSRREAGYYPAVKARLQYALSRANPKDRNSARWNLATFELGNGMAAEAYAILQMMLKEKSSAEDAADFHAVRGAAYWLMNRKEFAKADLMLPVLDGDPFVNLWRTLLLEDAGEYDAALTAFQRGQEALSRYPDRYLAEFLLAAGRAALASKDHRKLNAIQGRLKKLTLTVRQKGDHAILTAQQSEAAGNISKAIAQYQDAERIDDRRTRAVAGLSRARINIAQKLLSIPQEIEALDRLRFVWRGDGIELEVLQRLGDLYLQKGDQRMALETYRAAATAFPKSKESLDLANKMANIFRDIFVNGKTERLDPVAALALYYDFRELTPLGADGDEVIRRLADRLVGVDLLDRAEQLLDHQVFNRLEGVAKAQIASQLAMIYIMDQKPDAALNVLRATRQPLIPRDVQNQRNRVEARALILKAEYEEAEVAIDGDRSLEADAVRGEIYWRSRNWRRFTDLMQAVLANKENTKLEPSDEEMVMREAIALDFLDDHEGLVALGRRFGEQMKPGRYAEAFMALTRSEERTAADTSLIARNVRDVQALQNTMDIYRREFAIKQPRKSGNPVSVPKGQPPAQGA